MIHLKVRLQLILLDESFRKEVREKLEESGVSWKALIPIKRPNSSDYSIIFAFLGVPSKNLAVGLPFFSQLTLVRTDKNVFEAFDAEIFMVCFQFMFFSPFE